MEKNLVLDLVLAHWAQIQAAFFFFKKVTRYHGQLSSCIISEKTDDPILRKICDKHTDGCDFIGCYQTNVENPKHKSMKFS